MHKASVQQKVHNNYVVWSIKRFVFNLSKKCKQNTKKN